MKIKIALPSGSLQAPTIRIFERAGIGIRIAERSYLLSFGDPEMEGFLLRAQEIPRYVNDGKFDAGITGRDWVLEGRARVKEVAPLDYSKVGRGPVRWVLAVPEGSPIKSLKDLEGKRVATELVDYTRRYLKKRGVHARVEFSWGATEVKAPILADAIIELTETGRSLQIHRLRELETILTSHTVFIANRDSWKVEEKRKKIENIALLLSGALEAEQKVGLKMNVPRDKIQGIQSVLPALHTPTISNLTDPGWVSMEVILDQSMVSVILPELKRAGACGIVEYPLNKVIY